MIAKDLLKAFHARRGPVYVEVMNFHDVYWVQVVKQDLISTIDNKFQPDEDTGFYLDERGFFSKDHGV